MGNRVVRYLRMAGFGGGGVAAMFCGGFGSGWFAERFDIDALVADFEEREFFVAAGRVEDYSVASCGLHQGAAQG